MAADIQKVLRRDLRHLAGSDQDERVEDHLEKAMANYEELRQVEKDHREMTGVSPAAARVLLTNVPPSVGDGLAVEADWVGDLLPLERLDLRPRRSSE